MKPIPLQLEGRYIVQTRRAHAFVKLRASVHAQVFREQRARFEREKSSLRILSGLAVPRLVAVTRGQLPAAFRGLSVVHVSTQVLPDFQPIDTIGLDHARLVAGWLFVVEHLVAFRRRKILYSDVRCTNVLAREHPFAVMIVDFEGCSELVPAGQPLRNFSYTPGWEPPELARGHGFTEASIVFQAGMLLPHILEGASKHAVLSARGMPTAWKRRLSALELSQLSPIITRSTARDPRRRFVDLEALQNALAAIRLPTAVQSALDELRAPYASTLARLRRRRR